jgi:hypothetical protein
MPILDGLIFKNFLSGTGESRMANSDNRLIASARRMLELPRFGFSGFFQIPKFHLAGPMNSAAVTGLLQPSEKRERVL